MSSKPRTTRRKAVLFVTHEHSTGNASLRYRSFNHAESLGFLGVSCDVARYGSVGLLASIDDYECIVLHRVPWKEASPFIKRAEALKKLVVSDTDDLVFEPDAAQHIEAIASMSDSWRTSWAESYRATMEACQGAIVATEPLREFARPLSSPIEVVSNVVSEEMIRLLARADPGRKGRRRGDCRRLRMRVHDACDRPAPRAPSLHGQPAAEPPPCTDQDLTPVMFSSKSRAKVKSTAF